MSLSPYFLHMGATESFVLSLYFYWTFPRPISAMETITVQHVGCAERGYWLRSEWEKCCRVELLLNLPATLNCRLWIILVHWTVYRNHV